VSSGDSSSFEGLNEGLAEAKAINNNVLYPMTN
jgi:hypothetical protein